MCPGCRFVLTVTWALDGIQNEIVVAHSGLTQPKHLRATQNTRGVHAIGVSDGLAQQMRGDGRLT